MNKTYKIKETKKLPDSEVEITAEITNEALETYKAKAFKKMKDVAELPGFRKGHVPDATLKEKIGELGLLEEAGEMAINDCFVEVLGESKVNFLGRPTVAISKISIGSPIEFKIVATVMPEVKLGDYKKIAKEKNKSERTSTEPTDKEVLDVIQSIRENIAHDKVHAEAGGGTEHNHRKIEDADLPVVDEAFIKMLGDFKNVEDFKAKIKENIKKEKEIKEKDKSRIDIIEEIISKSTIDLPKIIIEGETDKMMAQFKDDIARSGLSIEEYLKHVKKTETDLRAEWKDTSVKRDKSQVILNNIAKIEGINAKEEDIKREMEHILAHHKDAERFRVRMYVETFLTNELVFQFLESQK